MNYILPSGVLALAGYLEQQGHEVKIVDAALLRKTHEEIAEIIATYEPELIGVSGIITAYAYIIGLTRAVKRALPAVPIVLGGQVGVSNEMNCFTHMAIDYLILGYGEIPLNKLTLQLQGLLPVELIPGLSWRSGDQIITNPGREFFHNLDQRPLPAYHLIDMEHYANSLRGTKGADYVFKGRNIPFPRALPVFGTLGCTDKCTFCIHEQEYVGIKIASNRVLIDHMKMLNERYDINIFLMGEEMFIANFQRAKQFNDMMKEELPNCYWSATTRANFITQELVDEMRTGNCLALDWGHESGSQTMLDLMNKRMTVAVNNRAYRLTQEANLYNSTTLMVGNPGESSKTVRETLRNIGEVGLRDAAVFFAAPYPGGRTWDWAVERGIIADTHSFLLSISDKDASRLSLNLTPYPDFVLRAWKAMLEYAQERVARKLNPEHPRAPSLKWGRRHYLRMRLRDFWLSLFLPALITVCCAMTWPLRTVRTLPGGKYRLATDSRGALRPSNLRLGKPQRAMSEEDISMLMKTTAPLKLQLSPPGAGKKG